jgi:arsenite methyltransferase
MAAQLTKADYGLDAPGVVVGNAVAGTAALAGAGIGWAVLRRRHRVPAAVLGGWLAVWGMVAVAQAGLMLRSSRAGKLTERDRLLVQLPWRGDERVLDVGCGRGLLLIGAARRLPTGRAVGLDLWRSQGQAGNDPAATMANAKAEGVAERVELRVGDARQLPFDEQTFDVVVSSMALHNIPGAVGRAAAVGEIVRVLKPGGRVAILDFRQEGIGQHGQGHPPVPGAPAADLVLVQAAQALAGLERLLHPPAGPGHPASGRPAAGWPGRRTRSRPARRCEGSGAPAASAATRAACRRRPAAGGPTHTSGGPWRRGRR